MRQAKLVVFAVVAMFVAMLAQPASGAPIVPSFTYFGTLADATFGGSGIPNDAVAVTQGGGVTLGLTAHQRFDNDAVTNDGAGNFFAAVGNDASSSPVAGYATWNFAFYMKDENPTSGNLYKFFWDFDPAFDNDRSTHGALLDFTLPANPHQDSQNLGMSHLTWFHNQPPSPGSFNPNLAGWYTFSLQALNPNSGLVAQTAIRVKVGDPGPDPVPEPTSMVLLGLGMLGAGVATRRRHQ
jgi:hypothetical protein